MNHVASLTRFDKVVAGAEQLMHATSRATRARVGAVPTTQRENAMAVAPLALAVLLLSFALPREHSPRPIGVADRIDSIYTELTGSRCATIAADQETGATTQRCPGLAGYALLVEDDDDRMSITVVAPNGGQHPLELWRVVTTGFSALGEKAEWRVKRENGKLVPVALIVRVNANATTSSLAVAKITPQAACVTDRIEPGDDMNLEARVAADAAAEKPCIKQTGL
jgi:hypothetical protein